MEGTVAWEREIAYSQSKLKHSSINILSLAEWMSDGRASNGSCTEDGGELHDDGEGIVRVESRFRKMVGRE